MYSSNSGGNSVNEGRWVTLDEVLDGLMRRYQERVPDVARVFRLLVDEGVVRGWEDIQNDHIAFRTMGVPHLGIESLEKIFLHYGYLRRDFYHFPDKKLNAYWYAPPRDRDPRIFISELHVGSLSQAAQAIIRSYTQEVKSDPVDKLNLDDGSQVDAFLHSGLWRVPTYSDYLRLAEESEYAAWVIFNRYYLNHFTISVHELPAGYNTIVLFNDLLERNGFCLNDAGGKAKVSSDGLLVQSSTVAAMVSADFDDGNGGVESRSIAGSYVEFAERRIKPEYRHLPPGVIGREHRRDGFEAANADKIFESTYRAQTVRPRA
jgi:hypothetical protein